jgi:hypothetical protein
MAELSPIGPMGQALDQKLLGLRPAAAPVGSPTHHGLSFTVPLSAFVGYLRRNGARLPEEMVVWILVDGERRWMKGLGPVNDGEHDLASMIDEYDLVEV